VTEFLRTLDELLTTGSVTLLASPRVTDLDRPAALERLEAQFHLARLDLAGPPLGFAGPLALEAAQFTLLAAWYAVDRQAAPAVMVKELSFPFSPQNPDQHLAVDLTFMFAAGLYRRAVRIDPSDPLTQQLEKVLTRWPLSGVLADLSTKPSWDHLEHPGLALLYAERLVQHEQINWLPRAGPIAEWAARVYHQLRRPYPAYAHPEEAPA
jgi:hypothetical protein